MTEGNNISAVADQMPSGAGLNNFYSELQQVAKPAADTPAPAPAPVVTPGTGGGWREKILGETKAPEQPEPKPIFEEVVQEQEKQQQQAAKPLDEKGTTLEGMLKVRNELQASMLAILAQSKNPDLYKMTDEELDFLAELYLPYWDSIKMVIPHWLPLAIMEFKIMGGLINRAYQDGKQNKKNTQAIRGGSVAQVVKAAAGANANDASIERTNFQIHADGTYVKNRDGSYHAAGEPGGELPDLTNKEHLERLIAKNGRRKVMRIFNITDADIENAGR